MNTKPNAGSRKPRTRVPNQKTCQQNTTVICSEDHTLEESQATVNAQPVVGPPVTRVEAMVDVGFRNSLFIRGQGAGLTWEKGQPLTCVDKTKWVWSCLSAKQSTFFKLLLNDQVWALGEDVVVEPGDRVELIPKF